VVRAIANSRIPVVSAVGHEIDITLADLAADVRALTPSEAAERVVPSAEDVTTFLRHSQSRLIQALRGRAAAARAQVEQLASARSFRRPMERVQLLARRLDELSARNERSMKLRLERARLNADRHAGRLGSLSPLAVLGRGYSLTHRALDGRLICTANDVTVGDQLRTRLARGELLSRVEGVENE
jgi:exodeoxyribonuclease VII large subunit